MNPHFWQLTEDHSLVYEQKKMTHLNEEAPLFPQGKNVITRSVGFEREILVDVIEKKLNIGDILIFCSDGLTGMVSDEKLSNIISRLPTKEIAPACIEEARKAGGDDNISVIVVSIENGGS